VTGQVEDELELDLDELEERFEVIERAITLTCVSNEVGGDLVGNAVWRGVRVADVLDAAGVEPGATQVVGRAFDDFTVGYPVEAAFDRDAMLAVGMNGAPLPAAHGFPLRMVVPGLYGYVSATKWLTELELTTFEAFDQYWVERDWEPRAPIKTMSRIDTPGSLEQVGGDTVAVAGVAWAQTRGIARVEVSVDGGPWTEAELGPAFNDVTWRQWVYRWDTRDLAPGRHELRCRATDNTGHTQVEQRQPPFPDGATGWHGVVVLA
jgi:DMSO/TMAO reductase YedYZ molybdopterin-dependent catalytic subunit